MKLNIKYWNQEKFLPTKRHRNLRERNVENIEEVDIAEPSADEFPVAFIVKDYDTVWEREGEDGDFKMVSTEIRAYKGMLWKAIRHSRYVYRAPGWLPIDLLPHIIEGYAPYSTTEELEFKEGQSIIQSDNKAECRRKMLETAADYLIFDGKVWNTCGEPMYLINTFGLGHNHGGTGFFVEYYYNPNISKNNYFNALQREEAIAYGKQVAANRGDDKSIEGMGDYDIIEVLMPEMVRRNPQTEHGDGNEFNNTAEAIINASDSSNEAGLLVALMAMSSASK